MKKPCASIPIATDIFLGFFSGQMLRAEHHLSKLQATEWLLVVRFVLACIQLASKLPIA